MAIPEYNEARYQRLNDVIFDYISDEEISGKALYDDIVRAVQESVDYFSKYRDKSVGTMSLLKGNREVHLDI